jgi:hypothetical protein
VSFFRSLFQDLVDKRLWPVAIVLVVAAVAVPVVLKKSEPQADTVAAARQPSPKAPVLSGTPVSLQSDGFHNALSGAPLKDPFRQQHLPKPPKSVTAAVATSQTSSSSSSTGSPSGGSTGGSRTGGGGSSKPPAQGSTKVKLRFGPAGTALKTYELAPLTALPSASNPILIYLGLLKDGKTAAFLVSSDGTPQGDGTCKPSASVCQTLLMKAGDTEFLDLNADTGAAQYELDVLDIVHG